MKIGTGIGAGRRNARYRKTLFQDRRFEYPDQPETEGGRWQGVRSRLACA